MNIVTDEDDFIKKNLSNEKSLIINVQLQIRNGVTISYNIRYTVLMITGHVSVFSSIKHITLNRVHEKRKETVIFKMSPNVHENNIKLNLTYLKHYETHWITFI